MFRPIDRGFFLKGVWRRAFGNRMVARARWMIVTSELEREDLVEGGVPPGRIRLRYNPVDLAQFESLPPRGSFRARRRISPDEPLVLFLSRLIPRKGADLLIEAFADALPARGALAIVGPEGEAGYLDHLRGVAERRGVSSRVRFTGPLYGDEKKAALADADVFALPSSYENFANAVAEALACRLPVVVTDRCGIHSLIDGRAGLVVARERKAVAEALRQMVENPELRSRFQAGCPAVARELSLEKTVAALESIYAER
jgi:glycosyltransferase involved in cell wall biosynthesis